MEILLLLLLVASAGVLFLPDILRERALDSPVDTVSDFKRGMTVLASSTHNYEPVRGQYYASAGEQPESYVRRGNYSGQDDSSNSEIMPYPRNKVHAEMEARRSRIIALLLVVTLATGIAAIIPSIRWIIPVHIAMLLILAIYIGLVILLPHYERRR